MSEIDLPPLPEPDGSLEGLAYFNPSAVLAFAHNAVLAERARWIRGVKISIPTDMMEQEFARYERSGYASGVRAERERCARICESVNSHDNPMTARDCADAIRKG